MVFDSLSVLRPSYLNIDLEKIFSCYWPVLVVLFLDDYLIKINYMYYNFQFLSSDSFVTSKYTSLKLHLSYTLTF